MTEELTTCKWQLKVYVDQFEDIPYKVLQVLVS